MWLVFVFFILLILEIFFSNINIILKKVVLNKNASDFRIDINFCIFKVLKIFTIKLNKDGVKFLNKMIPFKKSIKEEIQKLKLNFEELKFNGILTVLKEVNPKIKKAKFALNLGIGDIFLTSTLVVMVSSIISVFLGMQLFETNYKKIDYKVIPEFNKLNFEFNGDFSINIKFFKIIKVFIKSLYEKKKNSKSISKSIRIEN